MSRGYEHIVGAFYGKPWAILPTKLAEIEAFLLRRVKDGPRVWDDDRPPSRAESSGPGYQLVGAAAVVKVQGTIVPRANVFTDWSGGTSAEQIGRAVETAANDPKVDAVVMDVNSPGGYVAGTPEAADKLLAARKAKPLYAVANHMMASGAYWLSSQATEIASPISGEVGSVGVIQAHIDQSKAEEMAGYKTTVITASKSPYKGEWSSSLPFSEDALAAAQADIDKVMEMFVGAIARGRSVRAAKVERDFGQGRVLLADDALAVGMIDRIATLEDVVNRVNKVRGERTRRKVQADLAALGLPTT